ncbi:alkaline phosphatase family protein [Sphaerisporangium sp. B11E5]|uniref:alkaline phosphatase family protein n=1 Tax=Sphaerisporangium sp. B11E5 TaxID=3153563 RepID=UPI00325C5BD6
MNDRRMVSGGAVRPHPRLSLRAVPGHILGALERADRGVVVLAVDGLSARAAAETWTSAETVVLNSTFPSTSATAWMTAVTGAAVPGHLVVGAVYRSPAENALVNVITGETIVDVSDGDVLSATPGPGPGDTLRGLPTVFEAAAPRARALVIGRELDTLTGPWVTALLRGAERVPDPDTSALDAEADDPAALAAAVARDVEGALAAHREDRPLLLWIYVNLDLHLHRHGYDDRALGALRVLERHALDWAGRGWTVLAHSDHGHVRCVRDTALEDAWARVDIPELCVLPAGGAGRVRWLYPREERRDEAAGRLRDALGEHAVVVDAAELPSLGLMDLTPAVRERIGGVVAIAASPRFPLPVPGLAYEHGALTEDETAVPLATWG